MNLIDRAISVFAPAAGLARAVARDRLEQIRSYDGAMHGRRTANWRADNRSANASVKGALPQLRARSRDVVRNTWWGARVQTVVKAHAVGCGLTPVFKTGNKTLDKKAAAAWRKWAKAQNCDSEGQLSINGLFGLATDCIVESGEVLARLVPVRPSQKAAGVVPLELQLLEPDHLDPMRDRVMYGKGLAPDSVVDQGIEYAKDGKRLAYWLFPVHPGAVGVTIRPVSVRIAAGDVLHAYRKVRIGQGRGVPWLAPVLLKGRDVADLEEAVVVKARIEACFAAFVKSNDSSRTLANSATTERRPDGSTRRIETLSPGTISYLDANEEIAAVAPTASLQFDSVLKNTWLTLAAGAGITYDQLTGDLTRANYSSLRAGKIEFRRFISQFQNLTLIDMLADPLMERWLEIAQDAGILPRRAAGYPVEWIMPAVEPIDPFKDMQADVLAVRSGRMSFHDFIASWGADPDTRLEEIADWYKEMDALGIVLDVDPRKALVSTKGGAAPEAATEANPANPDEAAAGKSGKAAKGKK